MVDKKVVALPNSNSSTIKALVNMLTVAMFSESVKCDTYVLYEMDGSINIACTNVFGKKQEDLCVNILEGRHNWVKIYTEKLIISLNENCPKPVKRLYVNTSYKGGALYYCDSELEKGSVDLFCGNMQGVRYVS